MEHLAVAEVISLRSPTSRPRSLAVTPHRFFRLSRACCLLDCNNGKWGICETIVTEDHDEYFKGEQVNVMQNGAELPLADSPLDGEGYPSSTEEADEQKDLALSLVF